MKLSEYILHMTSDLIAKQTAVTIYSPAVQETWSLEWLAVA
jgi:hypothetical protein